jgi:membrane-bound serine protease (ClpP class)
MLTPSLFDSFYSLLLDPNIIFLLFIVAMIGVYLEISHPGAILPGTVGGIALLLFLFAIGSLSPNWAGLGLMVLAFVLLVLDLRLPTHGVLTVGALISLVIGAFIFFNSGSPYGGSQINPWVVYSMAALIGLISLYLISVIIRSRRNIVYSSIGTMIGGTAIATTPLLPTGRVRYGDEDWAAVIDDPVATADAGSEVRIVAIEGLRLHVQPIRHEVHIDTDAIPSLE